MAGDTRCGSQCHHWHAQPRVRPVARTFVGQLLANPQAIRTMILEASTSTKRRSRGRYETLRSSQLSMLRPSGDALDTGLGIRECKPRPT